MGANIQQIYTALTEFPGNIVYHIIVSFSVLNALISAISSQRKSQTSTYTRTLIGLGALLGIRFIVFFYSIIFPPLSNYAGALLPVLDWLTTSLSSLIIIWLWIFPQRSKLGDTMASVVGLLSVILAIVSGVWWLRVDIGLSFNQSFLDDAWNLYNAGLLIAGIVLLIIRTPVNHGIGLGMLVMLLVGHLLHIVLPNSEGYFPGSVRLLQIAVFPLLYSLSRRWEAQRELKPVIKEESMTVEGDSGPYRIEPVEFRHIKDLFEEFFPGEIEQLVARIVGEIMKTDLSFRIVHTLERGFCLEGGYDRHMQKGIADINLHEKDVPLLTSSSRKSKPLRLQASSKSPDLHNIGKALGLKSPGHLMAGFFSSFDNAGILLMNSHSNKRWDQEAQKYFVEITNSIHTFFRELEKISMNDEDKEIEIIPDSNNKPEVRVQKETLLRLIDFIKSQPT